MLKPTVSVIMPAFNAERFLAEAIDSVIHQTHINWELLIINDGSTDSTGVIADSYAETDNRIKVIHQENKKLGAARNAALVKATGNWIGFLDADDLWVPNKLEKQLRLAAEIPEAGVIFSDGFIFNDTFDSTTTAYGTVYGLIAATDMYRLQFAGNYIPVLSAMVKSEHSKKAGFQDENSDLLGCEDWDYWLRLCLNGVSFYGMKDMLFYYRRHSSNMSNNEPMMRFAKANVFLKNFRPELLGKSRKVSLVNFINITICQFVKTTLIKEALTLNKNAKIISNSFLRNVGTFLIYVFKQRAYYPLRIILKIDKLINSLDA